MYIGGIVQEKINRTEKKTIKKGGLNSIFSMFDNISSEELAQVSAMPKAQVSTAWMLQEIDGYAQDQQKMKQTGDRLLKYLSDIRIGILCGEITIEHMKHLKDALPDSTIMLQFPELQDVIADITLRAEVELAKLELAVNDDEERWQY